MNILIYTKHEIKCPECYSKHLKTDYYRKETYCLQCGLVCKDTTKIDATTEKRNEIEREKLRETNNNDFTRNT